MKKLLQNKSFRASVTIAICFFLLFSILGTLRSHFLKKHDDQNDNGNIVQSSINNTKINLLPNLWKFQSGDNKNWCKPEFNDSLWLPISPLLVINKTTLDQFNGICWFRIKFSVNSANLNQVLALNYFHNGASEVYLDGKFLGGYGKVSSTKLGETGCIPNFPVYFAIGDLKPHILSIRYSNQLFNYYKDKYNQSTAGISDVFVIADPSQLYTSAIRLEQFWVINILTFGFFITLSLVHFLLYIFYRKHVQNLYYSIFVFIFALLTIAIYLFMHTIDPETRMKIQHDYFGAIITAFLISVMLCAHSLFKPSLYKRIFFIQLFTAALILIADNIKFFEEYISPLLFFLGLFTSFECIRSVFSGFRKKMQGAKIIGTGILVFFLFIVTLLFEGFVTGEFNFRFGEGISTAYYLILFMLCIISIPLSMSIYLARNFGITNNELTAKLIEVEDLSAKSIAQEKEKQHILENQNITLEKQVTERTVEITEQKKVIEEKNKDIIDSINYAKRIQSAMLPEEAAFKAIFNNSFVLYMPRDIVSGDFYYATELNGNKLIIAADCTGHGVPGALMSMVGCNIINKLAHENKIIEPKIILETLHTQLRQALKQDLVGSLNRDGMDVAAVLIKENEIVFASANRPLIYFDHKNQLNEIKATKTPIGGSHIELVNIEQHTFSKENIKELFLFSDGFADQFGGPDGKKLMVSKFKLWLSQIINLEAQEQHQFLQTNFTTWKKESEQVDDVMVIGIKI